MGKTKKDIVQLYLETKDFNQAVRLSGLPPLAAHIKLLASGVLDIKDKIEYLPLNASRGAMAEDLFWSIVPEAIPANKVIRRNNKNFDFLYGNLEVEIKYASILDARESTRNKARYTVSVHNQKNDIVIIFAEREKGVGLYKPYIFFIPSFFIQAKYCYSITIGSSRFKQFLVSPQELKNKLSEYNNIIEKKKSTALF